jgi:hypothetical protein
MSNELEQTIPKITPDNLPQAGYELGPRDAVMIDLLAEESVSSEAEQLSIDGERGMVLGRKALTITLEDGTQADVVDIRMHEVFNGARSIGGTRATGPIEVGETTSFVLLVRSPDREEVDVRPLPAQELVTFSATQNLDGSEYPGSVDGITLLESGSGYLSVRGSEAAEAVLIPPETPYAREADRRVLGIDAAVELISYADVLSGDELTQALEHVRNSPNGMKYAAELVELSQQYGKDHIAKVAQKLVADCTEILARYEDQFGLQPTPYAKSISWAMWDIAKQSYLAKHPEESSPEYVEGGHGVAPLENPLEDNYFSARKRDEIVNRHLGWELFMAKGQQLKVPIENMPFMLKGAFKAAWSDHADLNETGQLRSYELANIGKELRIQADHMPGGARYRDPTKRQRER